MSALFLNLPIVACIVGAVVLALHDAPGWGWLLVLALALPVARIGARTPDHRSDWQ